MFLRQEPWCVTDAHTVSCAASLENVRILTNAVREWIGANGFDENLATDLELAVAEAANNVVLHGTEGLQDQTISLTISCVPGGIEVAIDDRGRPIPPGVLDKPVSFDLTAESGRGMGLIAACTDRIDYMAAAEGNRLVLFKAAPQPADKPVC